MLIRYLRGIIGGILGGAIASIPWIIFYVYGNKIISPLTIIIAVGALKGYKVAKGPINRSLFSIVAVIAISCVTIATLVIIPLLLIIQSKVQITLGELYTISTFTSTMLQDYLLALIFTLIGISAVIVMIKEQISDSKPKANRILKKNIKKVLATMIKHNAKTKTTAVDFAVLLTETKIENLSDVLKYLLAEGKIAHKKNSYYLK